MSYTYQRLVIVGLLSNSHDEREDEHDRLWGELADRIRQLLKEPQYADLRVELENDL